MQPKTYVFFGIVGSGKGTQASFLADDLKKKDGRESVIASTGEEFRRIMGDDSLTGKLVRESMHKGELQPDFLTNAIFATVLSSSLTNEKHLITDGYPRTVVQAETFSEMMRFYGRKDIKIIYIEVGKDEALRRNLLRGRHDDTKEGIARRFNEYVNNVIPAMNYFKDKDGYEIIHINGEQSREDVHRDINKALGL